ncbi:MAG: hypothetical protein QE265_11860 [Rhodoferax sp.]|nr:hypothetical protein [Rhodoferax sp.]
MLQGRSQCGGQAHCVLLGRYVHDSLAGFVLAGPVTHDDKARLLVDIVHREGKGEALNDFESTVFANYRQRIAAEKAGTVQVPQRQTGIEKLVRDRVENNKLLNATNRKDQLAQKAAYDEEWRFEYSNALYVNSCALYPVLRDEDARLLQSGGQARATGVITSGRHRGCGYFLLAGRWALFCSLLQGRVDGTHSEQFHTSALRMAYTVSSALLCRASFSNKRAR